jgi:hypothetical protein
MVDQKPPSCALGRPTMRLPTVAESRFNVAAAPIRLALSLPFLQFLHLKSELDHLAAQFRVFQFQAFNKLRRIRLRSSDASPLWK